MYKPIYKYGKGIYPISKKLPSSQVIVCIFCDITANFYTKLLWRLINFIPEQLLSRKTQKKVIMKSRTTRWNRIYGRFFHWLRFPRVFITVAIGRSIFVATVNIWLDKHCIYKGARNFWHMPILYSTKLLE